MFIIEDYEEPICSVTDALQVVREFQNVTKSINETNGNGKPAERFYRGQADYEWDLRPSVFRSNRLLYENELFWEILRLHPDEFQGLTDFEKLQKMQHFELPTRLLDITTNPLVALYFACQRMKRKDGKMADGRLALFASKRVNAEDLCIKAIMFLVKEPVEFDMDGIIEELGCSAYEFNRYVGDDYIVTPSMSNDRILSQRGAFIMFGNRLEVDEDMPDDADVWKKPHSLTELEDGFMGASFTCPHCHFYRIPSKNKASILRELSDLDIRYETLFPGLSSSAKALTVTYDAYIERQTSSKY